MHDADTVGPAASRILFAHASDGVLLWTHDGRITAANPAACTMLDLPAEEICRLGRDGLVDRGDSRWGIALAESERTGSAVGVARLRRGDGRSIRDQADGAAISRRGRGAADLLHPARPDRAPRR